MRTKIYSLAGQVVSLFVLGFGLTAAGMTSSGSDNLALVEGRAYRLMLEAGTRWQQGTAWEIVNVGSFMLSELTWDIKDVLFVGGHLRLELPRRIALGIRYWEAITEGNGAMTNYDFILPGIWSDFSDGPVDVNRAYDLDVYADWAFWQHHTMFLHLVGGYKRLYWDWSQYGGSFIYSHNGFRDVHGDFPPAHNGINYQQTFDIPYAGLRLNTKWRKWHLGSYMLYSPLARAGGLDEHVMRKLYFEDTFRDVEYYATGMSAAYHFAQRWHISGAWDWHDIPRTRGDVRIIDQTDGAEEHFSDMAAIAHRTWNLSLSGGIYF